MQVNSSEVIHYDFSFLFSFSLSVEFFESSSNLSNDMTLELIFIVFMFAYFARREKIDCFCFGHEVARAKT